MGSIGSRFGDMWYLVFLLDPISWLPSMLAGMRKLEFDF